MKMEKKIINLMPCPVNLILEDSERVFPVSGKVARCFSNFETIKSFDGVPITRRRFGNVIGLPKETPGTKYIVMQAVAEACPERNDLLVPMAPDRDTDGRIKGYYYLAILS